MDCICPDDSFINGIFNKLSTSNLWINFLLKFISMDKLRLSIKNKIIHYGQSPIKGSGISIYISKIFINSIIYI